MRYGILSDIHGNLQALQAVLAALKTEGVDSYVCLGDVVGYGANPQECLELLTGLTSICLSGNHEWAVLDKIDTSSFNEHARSAVEWTKARLSDPAKSLLGAWPLVYKNHDLVAVHATLFHPERFAYLMSVRQARETFMLMDKKICFIGHTHAPGILVEQDQAVSAITSPQCRFEPQARYIVNVGSVGQPRDGNPLAAYCIYDTDEKGVNIRRINYDIAQAQRRIMEAGLPDFLAQRLALGR
jgi:predicted phosphodiesterase